MNPETPEDFAANALQEIGRFERDFILSPEKMTREDYVVSRLEWDSIRFGAKDGDKKIPNERGVYAFTICHPNKVLPSHGYVIYIGIAGQKSSRAIRARYKDYLNDKAVLKRNPALVYAIGTWRSVLRFYFAPVDNSLSLADLRELEKQLNTALLPPCSKNDLEADTKRKRGAF